MSDMSPLKKRMTSLIDEVINSNEAIEILGGEGGREPIKDNCTENIICGTDLNFDLSCLEIGNAGNCPPNHHLCFLSE